MSTESNRLELSVTLGGNAFSAAGDTDVVTELYRDFKEAAAATGAIAPPSSTSSSGAGSEAGGQPAGPGEVRDQPEPAEVKAPTTLPLRPYLDRLNLPGNKEKAAAIIAWSAESGHKASLTISEIKTLWRKETPFRAPGNLARDVSAAKGQGWLDRDGVDGSPNTTYSVNGYGEGVINGWIKSEG